jgi:DNA polymerase-3 subunit epsilon
MERVAVLDFETTGMSPDLGDRPTEIAIALVEDGRIVDRFRKPDEPGPAHSGVRHAVHRHHQRDGGHRTRGGRGHARSGTFRWRAASGGAQRVVRPEFWVAQLRRLALDANTPFACTMLLGRRVYPECHKLGALVEALQLPRSGRAHRAPGGQGEDADIDR